MLLVSLSAKPSLNWRLSELNRCALERFKPFSHLDVRNLRCYYCSQTRKRRVGLRTSWPLAAGRIWRAVCFKIHFFIGYKFLISFADRIYRLVIDQLKYYYIVLIFYQIRKIDQPAYHQSIICLVNSIICLYDRSVVRNQP